jgi:transcription elongation factor GreA
MKNVITQEGYEKLKQELQQLKKVKRKEIAGKIKESIDFGDISENSELDDIRNEQAFLEGRIQKLEYMIREAEIIENSSHEVVDAGSKVVLLAKKETVEYVLVGPTESDPTNGKISMESPLGQALVGRKKGEKISLDTISGANEYKILDIK